MALLDLFRREPSTEWEPMIDTSISLRDMLGQTPRSFPLKMRRWFEGKYIYRDATEQEVQDYMAAEAW